MNATLFRSTATDPERFRQEEPDDDAALRSRRSSRLVCRRCGQHISDGNHAFAASGTSTTGVFANAHGRVFQILTVRAAQGLLFVGAPTTEFTWFSGYAWRVAVCAGCTTHLGWSFEAARPGLEPVVFFGLLSSEIAERRAE